MKRLLWAGFAGVVLSSTSALAGAPFGGEELNFDKATANYGPLSVYGDFRYSIAVRHVDFDSDDDTMVDTEDNNSRLGFGGQIGLAGDSSVFYNISFQNDSDTGGEDTVRDIYAGLRGGWGEVFAGQRRTKYVEVSRWVDPFYDVSTSVTMEGSSFGSGFFNGFDDIQPDQVGYRSPQFGPINFNLAVFSDDDTSEDDVGFELGFGAGGSIGADGLWAVSVNALINTGDTATVFGSSEDQNFYKIAGGADFGFFGVGLQLQHIEIDDVDFDDEPLYLQAGVTLDVSQTGMVAINVGLEDYGDGVDGYGANAGYFWDLGDNVTLHGILSYTGFDDDFDDVDFFSLVLGTSIHFNVGMI